MLYNTLVEYALSALVKDLPRPRLCELLTRQNILDCIGKISRYSLGKILQLEYNERLRFCIPSANLLDILFLTDPRHDIDFSWIASINTIDGVDFLRIVELADLDKVTKTPEYTNILVNQPRPVSGNQYIMLNTIVAHGSAIRGIENRSFGIRFIIDVPEITPEWTLQVCSLYGEYLVYLLNDMLPVDSDTKKFIKNMMYDIDNSAPPKLTGAVLYDNSIQFVYRFGYVI